MTTFDPRVMVLPPYETCPYCRALTFGVVAIDADRYRRRCRTCLRPNGSERRVSCLLPPVRKRILYLDQFAFTHAAYLLHPQLAPVKAERLRRERPAWAAALERIVELVSAQVLVCPVSGFHVDEALPFAHGSEVYRTMQSLSGGVRLEDHHRLEIAQLVDAFVDWLVDRGHVPAIVSRPSALQPDPHQWSARYTVGMELNSIYGGLATETAEQRKKRADALRELARRWVPERRTLAELVNEELAGYADAVFSEIARYEAEIRAYLRLLLTWDPALGRTPTPVPPVAVDRWRALLRVLPDGMSDDDKGELAAAFLRDADALRGVPAVALKAMLYAALARKVAGGQKDLNDGTVTDIEMFAAAAPYCDAIVLDRACADLVRASPARSWLEERHCRVFVAGDGIEEWLDATASAVDQNHVDVVREVYGPDAASALTRRPG